MSFLSTSFIDQRAAIKTTPDNGTFPEYMSIDLVTGEVHEYKSLIATNPIEDGSVVSDHQTLLPLTITMQGFFTDTPISKNNPFTTYLESFEGRARDQFDKLVAIRNLKTKFTLITGIKAYPNLLFEEISAPRASGKGQRVDFSAKITQVLITNANSSNKYKNVAENVEHSVAGLISLGTVPLI